MKMKENFSVEKNKFLDIFREISPNLNSSGPRNPNFVSETLLFVLPVSKQPIWLSKFEDHPFDDEKTRNSEDAHWPKCTKGKLQELLKTLQF